MSRRRSFDDMIAKKASSNEHPADRHDLIRVQGARENNLKDVSVEIPKRRRRWPDPRSTYWKA